MALELIDVWIKKDAWNHPARVRVPRASIMYDVLEAAKLTPDEIGCVDVIFDGTPVAHDAPVIVTSTSENPVLLTEGL